LLELFSTGLVSIWLKMVGVPTTLDPWQTINQTDWQSVPSVVSATDPSAEAVIQQYLKQLASQGLDASSQGIWLQSGTTLLASHQGTVAMPAASLTKIATSLAALSTWGPDYQFETPILATGQVHNGELQGDLIIQGTGDPLIVSEDAIALGNALNKIGITRITGNLIITGRFMLNFEPEPLQAGEMLKKFLDPKKWDDEVQEEFALLPEGTHRPTITIAGAVRAVSSIEAVTNPIPLMRHRSLPLTYLLKSMNNHSNNEMSQLLTDTMGGVQTMLKTAAAAAGLTTDEIQFVNGSGLSMDNRLSAHAACALFAAIDRLIQPKDLTLGDLFPVSGLESAGTTLEDRLMPENLVVKTGTLNEVSALAGILPTRDRGFVQFAIINRGTDITALRKQQDMFLQALQHQWGSAPSAEMVQPSLWVKARRSTLGATLRNEIVYGG
jgi:D-alanyl-D-alanine carboxypeptidase/D-alanyl-D-alanine-endopeptidase (penicillin-binding protein 4)